MLRGLSGDGIRPLLVDWGTPDPAEHALDLGGHITELLQPMLRELGAPYHLIGYCLGGTMSVASAVLSPPLSLTLIATPWDFDGFSDRSAEHTSEVQSLMRTSYAVFCLKKNNK